MDRIQKRCTQIKKLENLHENQKTILGNKRLLKFVLKWQLGVSGLSAQNIDFLRFTEVEYICIIKLIEG